MARSLKELQVAIMQGNNRHEEWMCLEKEVDEAMRISTEEEIRDFVDSGAGEVLDMLCSAVRNIQIR